MLRLYIIRGGVCDSNENRYRFAYSKHRSGMSSSSPALYPTAVASTGGNPPQSPQRGEPHARCFNGGNPNARCLRRETRLQHWLRNALAPQGAALRTALLTDSELLLSAQSKHRIHWGTYGGKVKSTPRNSIAPSSWSNCVAFKTYTKYVEI
jgi:hypothetical protein